MKRQKIDKYWLRASVAGFFVLAASFLLMPVEGYDFLPGILFWLGLFAGCAGQIILESRRRAFFKSYAADRKKWQRKEIGLLAFFSNKLAVAADLTVLISLVCLTVTLIVTRGRGYLCYVMLAVLVFAFCMHCVLNGRNYFHACNQNRVRRVLEQKK